MNTSSFLCGVLTGAVVSMMMSKKRNNLMSTLGGSGMSVGGAADRAKDKIVGMALTGFGNTSASADRSHDNSKGRSGGTAEHKPESLKSKEDNMRMLKDFIRSNPDVKHDVEQILKETHTAIPGL
ncbi:hypothetical protein GCM10010912_20750 [Paenibacillus albidus]|uniref:Uncharacterized protein n=1 Tax=Paenibacillus albidus TaxID=2041023 RepID=A0A917C888_9BACL|nr:hypothetical protein [Paenibacillus albidus]GGF75425.1 hypothetical protein GCM10010912_20750 [Paenibacillus albidus]